MASRKSPRSEHQPIDECEAFIRASRTFDRAAEFIKFTNPNAPGTLIPGKEILESQNRVIDSGLAAICRDLMATEQWRELASDSKAFGQKLDGTLKFLGSVMRWRYGIPKNRKVAPANRRRDNQIFEMKEAGKSFGEIRLAINREMKTRLSEQAIRQAYERYRGKDRKMLTALYKMASESMSVNEFLEIARREGVPLE
jgi:hypothetical protein